MTMMEKLQQQIDYILDENMRNAYFDQGHTFERHVLSNSELQERIWNMPRANVNDIVMACRFDNKVEALQLIYETLLQNIDAIAKWINDDVDLEFVATSVYDKRTGDGLAKNADINNFIPVHGVTIVLKRMYGSLWQSFGIVTAYPCQTFDDIDVVYDAIDSFQMLKKR